MPTHSAAPTYMSANTWSTFNSFEVNLVVAGNNTQDQMVLNPNGHWYRQCKTGYFFTYLFGLPGDGHR